MEKGEVGEQSGEASGGECAGANKRKALAEEARDIASEEAAERCLRFQV